MMTYLVIDETDLIIIMIEQCSSYVHLCGEKGLEALHNFFVQFLTKDGWLDDLINIE